MTLIIPIGTFACAVLLSWLTRSVMIRLGIVDRPEGSERKIHRAPIALGGGVAVYLAMCLGVALLVVTDTIGTTVPVTQLVAVGVAGLVIIMGGITDDRHALAPRHQLIAPVIATMIVLLFGIGPTEVTNPLGGVIPLDQFQLSAGPFGTIVLLADILVFVWLMGVMYTTKLLDGLDGLVTGVVTIGALIIYFLSTQQQWHQPEVAALSLTLAAACAGFLVWNWHPARMFLGEGGSLVTGFFLGVLAIISGAKIATTFLVLGLPILDLLRVFWVRRSQGRSIFEGDMEHLHFRLLHSGLTQKQAVLLFYAISLLLGLSTLFVQSNQLISALLLFCVIGLLVWMWFSVRDADRKL